MIANFQLAVFATFILNSAQYVENFFNEKILLDDITFTERKKIFRMKWQGCGYGSSGIRIIWVAGSGSRSAFKLRIQIRIQVGKNDPQK
jgi:hypothetical protein